MRPKWYVGARPDFCLGTQVHEAFKSETIPVSGDYPYLYAIGPFKTKRGAEWLVSHPHTTCQTVAEIERVAARD